MKTNTKQTILYVSQYGDYFYAKTLKDLREQVSGRCSIMYQDTADGTCCRTGYVIGYLWLTAYVPLIKPIS